MRLYANRTLSPSSQRRAGHFAEIHHPFQPRRIRQQLPFQVTPTGLDSCALARATEFRSSGELSNRIAPTAGKNPPAKSTREQD